MNKPDIFMHVNKQIYITIMKPCYCCSFNLWMNKCKSHMVLLTMVIICLHTPHLFMVGLFCCSKWTPNIHKRLYMSYCFCDNYTFPQSYVCIFTSSSKELPLELVHFNIEHERSDLKLHQMSNQMQQTWVAFVSFPTNHVYVVYAVKHVCKSSESVSCRWKVFPSAARFEYRNHRSSFTWN
jgi:hypothetical protein